MNIGDLVYLNLSGYPSVGQIVGFTPKRVRVAIGSHRGYTSVLRSEKNIKQAKKVKKLI